MKGSDIQWYGKWKTWKNPTKSTYTKEQLNANLWDTILSQVRCWEITPLLWWKACKTLWISLVSQSMYIIQALVSKYDIIKPMIHEYMRFHIAFRCKTVLVIISINTLPSEICTRLLSMHLRDSLWCLWYQIPLSYPMLRDSSFNCRRFTAKVSSSEAARSSAKSGSPCPLWMEKTVLEVVFGLFLSLATLTSSS